MNWAGTDCEPCSGEGQIAYFSRIHLQAPTAGGSVSRLLLNGTDLGEVDSAPGCTTDLAKPSPWKLPAS